MSDSVNLDFLLNLNGSVCGPYFDIQNRIYNSAPFQTKLKAI